MSQVDYFNDDVPETARMHWIYYLTHTLQVVYLIGFVASAVLFINAFVVHTHFYPGMPNNDLYSERYTSLWWTSLLFGTMRFIFFIFMTFMFMFRNIVCGRKRYAGCTITWVCLMVGILALDFVGLIINGHYLATCNDVNAVGNPCNSADWCCLPAVRIIPTNHCPNEMSGSCLPGLVPSKNPTFLGIFSVNVIFVVLELYFVLLPIVLWFNAFRAPPTEADKAEEDATEVEFAETKSALETLDPALAVTGESIPVTFKTVNVVQRRPAPQTPLLAAAANRLIAHVIPGSSAEKNTKQP